MTKGFTFFLNDGFRLFTGLGSGISATIDFIVSVRSTVNGLEGRLLCSLSNIVSSSSISMTSLLQGFDPSRVKSCTISLWLLGFDRSIMFSGDIRDFDPLVLPELAFEDRAPNRFFLT